MTLRKEYFYVMLFAIQKAMALRGLFPQALFYTQN
jgi:hypothetical protein